MNIIIINIQSCRSKINNYDIKSIVGNINNNSLNKQTNIKGFSGTYQETYEFNESNQINIEFSSVKGTLDYELIDPKNKSIFKTEVSKDSKYNIKGKFIKGEYKIIYKSNKLECININITLQ